MLNLSKSIPSASESSVAMDDSDKPLDVYSGVRWSAAAKYGTQAVEVGTSLYVARIVDPEAYGLLGMAIVITGFLMVFQDLGFSSALVQRKEISDSLTNSLFYVNLAVSTLMAACLFAGAPLFSWIYGEPRVGPVVAVLSVMFIFSGLGLVPSALLTRCLAFQRLAWVEIAVSAVRAASVIALALAGWGVWALVWSSVVGVIVQTILLYSVSHWRPQWQFRLADVRSVLGYGANLTGFSIFNYFARNADNLIIGAFLGATPLGHYSLAYRILLFPRDAVTGVLTRVLFPAFSQMQDDDARLAAAYLRTCGAVAFITFPLMIGLVIVARPFVEVVLGPSWLPAVPLIYVLAPVGMFHSVATTTGNIYLAKGRTDWMFRWGVFSGLLVCVSFFLGLPWGVLGVAVAYSIANVLLVVPVFSIPFRLVKGLSLRGLVRALTPYAICTCAMAIIVAGFRFALSETGIPGSLVLLLSVTVGIGSYTVIVLSVCPQALDDLSKVIPHKYAWLFRIRMMCRNA